MMRMFATAVLLSCSIGAGYAEDAFAMARRSQEEELRYQASPGKKGTVERTPGKYSYATEDVIPTPMPQATPPGTLPPASTSSNATQAK